MYKLRYLIILFSFIGFLACSNDTSELGCPEGAESSHTYLGNPSNASGDEDNYLIQLPSFALSYNESRGIPNWVSWNLTSQWMGESFRQDDFRAYDLPSGWFSPDEDSYRNSGFNRGHNCPSADRTCSDNTNSETFYMINMVPQSPDHNQETWANLEQYGRDLVRRGNEIYYIMGNYGVGGFGFFGYKKYIADGKIAVPESIYKIMVVLPQGENDLNRIDENTRVIAVNIQNTNFATDDNWWHYRTTVDEIEEKTGYDFLSQLPTSVQDILESKVDNVNIEF